MAFINSSFQEINKFWLQVWLQTNTTTSSKKINMTTCPFAFGLLRLYVFSFTFPFFFFSFFQLVQIVTALLMHMDSLCKSCIRCIARLRFWFHFSFFSFFFSTYEQQLHCSCTWIHCAREKVHCSRDLQPLCSEKIY